MRKDSRQNLRNLKEPLGDRSAQGSSDHTCSGPVLFIQFQQPIQKGHRSANVDSFPVFSINFCFHWLFFPFIGYDGSQIADREN